jgi:hypothetical protein
MEPRFSWSMSHSPPMFASKQYYLLFFLSFFLSDFPTLVLTPLSFASANLDAAGQLPVCLFPAHWICFWVWGG